MIRNFKRHYSDTFSPFFKCSLILDLLSLDSLPSRLEIAKNEGQFARLVISRAVKWSEWREGGQPHCEEGMSYPVVEVHLSRFLLVLFLFYSPTADKILQTII